MNIFSHIPSFLFGETTYRNGGRFGPISHPQLEFVIVQNGSVSVDADGFKNTLIEGYAMLVPSLSNLQYDYHVGVDARVSWCEAVLPHAYAKIIAELSGISRKIPVSRRMLELHRMGLSLEFGDKPEEDALTAALGRALFQEYVYQTQILQREKPIHKAALRAKFFIEQNVSNPCTLSDIAKYSNATPQYLTRVFKRDIGQTPVAYLWSVRAQKAVQMIRNSGLSIAEIAYSCGYENANHFSRHIKEKFGAAPTEIRRRKWG